ncbi:hypothetical protein EJ07DRAFT_82225, partial [Lizonia empirigonia]
RNMELKKVAEETKAILPAVLKSLPGFRAEVSSIHDLGGLVALDAKDCPRHVLPNGDQDAGAVGTRIRVLDKDSFDAAIELQPNYTAHGSGRPVAVLNLASERHAGGGWQNGAMAQEEALCYRSSLYLSLHKSYYPLPSLSVIYTPNVLIIRSATSAGHTLYKHSAPDLSVTSVISVAALRHPALSDDHKKFKNEGQRAETKRKIRVSLRLAASNGHTRLILGALGCGVFSNPPTDVAECFLEVFKEKEFQGGWWEDVVFAVMDNARGNEGGKDGTGNFGQFHRVLDG